jgi:hypothetical protein
MIRPLIAADRHIHPNCPRRFSSSSSSSTDAERFCTVGRAYATTTTQYMETVLVHGLLSAVGPSAPTKPCAGVRGQA